MVAEPRKAYILAGVEPEFDCGDGAAARRAMEQADKVLAVTPYANDAMKNYADILLPVATFAETSGTFVNGVGMWQSFPGAGVAPGEVRPAWKVLRVLGNLLGLEGFDYISSNDIRGELKEQCRDLVLDNGVDFTREIKTLPRPEGLVRCGDVPIYAADGLVRRAGSLQRTKDAAAAAVFICASQAGELGLKDAQEVKAQQQDETVILPLVIHDSIPHGCAWISAGLRESSFLGPLYGPVSLVNLEPY
jgi:NADH-quinone oxidoreductase subunit G